MELFPVYPLQNVTIARAEGSFVYDESGKRYLDFYGGHAVIIVGHRHPHWVKRITDQLSKIAFYSNSVHLPIQTELAKKLGQVSGKPDYHLFLCNSGAEANENAFKVASFYNQRKTIVAFKGGFHGRTSLAAAATDNPSISAPVNVTSNIHFLPFNDETALKEYFSHCGKDISAVIVEGIQGVGGIQVASKSFLQLIRALCDQHQAVYIADSVQCGYGRSGDFFSHDYAGVSADLYTTAKGMGNGFPVAGVLIHPKFSAKFGILGTTFGGNPLACAAALGVLEVYQNENILESVRSKGEYLLAGLKKISGLQNIRGRGLMIGFEPPASQPKLKEILLNEFRIFVGESKPNTIRLLPTLTISLAEIDELLEALRRAVA